MKIRAVRTRIILAWIALAVLIAAIYGIINDQITVTLSPEYFSVFKRAQFFDALVVFGLSDAPTRVQAVLVGILATWWFGLLLGIGLGAVGMVGRHSPLHTRDFLQAVGGVVVVTLLLSMLFGAVAYAVEPVVRPTVDQWPFLEGIRYVRGAFAVGWWHNGAYLGGLLGTVIGCSWVRRKRRCLPKADS